MRLYKSTNPIEEQQAIKEILQEIALYPLWRGGFFEVASFQWRYEPAHPAPASEVLRRPRLHSSKNRTGSSSWSRYLDPLLSGLTEFGLQSEVLDKSDMDRNVREAMLKNDSIANSSSI